MQWAQAALERNPSLEIMGTDREARVFTVRDRRNQLTAAVQLAEIAAAPLAFLTQPAAAPQDEAPAQPAPAAVTPLEPEAVTRLASEVVPPPPEPTAEPTKPATYTIERSSGRTRVTGDGISVVYGESAPVRMAGAAAEPGKPYSVDRSSGAVRVSGPGVSIEPTGEPNAPLDGAEIEPVICEGPRVMQLDSRTLNVEGDALIARGGCQLYITNSTIVASGIGVVISDATVHINNSSIAGGLASFDAKEQAKVFLRGSTLNGLSRRNARAQVQDQGGNRYQ